MVYDYSHDSGTHFKAWKVYHYIHVFPDRLTAQHICKAAGKQFLPSLLVFNSHDGKVDKSLLTVHIVHNIILIFS